MLVLLVGPDCEENLSLRYLASSLRAAGHRPRLAAFDSLDDAENVVHAAGEADLVGLSLCFQARAREFLSLARLLKERYPALPIVAGGHYASCAAEPLLEHHPELDLVVLHEGERALVELADLGPCVAEQLGDIAGIAYRSAGSVRMTPPRPALADLDQLPPPDREGRTRRQAGVPIAYLLGGRGCLGACSYCCITTLHRMAPGKCFRQRAPERVADEMASLYWERGVRQFVFHDDNFLVPSRVQNHARLDALEQALSRRGVRDIGLVIKCRPQDAEESLLKRLRDLGLLRVFFGIESANEDGLGCLGRTHTVAQAERALELAASLGVSAQFTIMLFHPDATLATGKTDVAFMRRHIAHPWNFCRTEIYAGTPLEARMLAEGRARGDYLARSYSLLDPAADVWCNLWKRMFLERCGRSHGLMNLAIGLDYRAAVLGRFHPRTSAALRDAIAAWGCEVRGDSLDLMEELGRLSEGHSDLADPGLACVVREVAEREERSRLTLVARGRELGAELDACVALLQQNDRRPSAERSPARFRPIARQAAALMLVGLTTAACEGDVSEMAPVPVDAGPDATRDASPDVMMSEMAPLPTDAGDASADQASPADAAPDYMIAEMAPAPFDGSSNGSRGA
jgi:radical SAM superfamily enzyme YgiQ (UPF0313 family)